MNSCFDGKYADMTLGTLYVVATPIGNLADWSERARLTVASVTRVFAEDTRVSATLLAHYGIKTPLASLNAHNESDRIAPVLAALQAGYSVALISDAGTPAVSDPGARVVAAARAAGATVVPIPGANAAIAALSASGIDGPFLFLGFLPARSAARQAVVAEHAHGQYALVIYEAPHRVAETIEDLVLVLAVDRQIVIAREITKKFETIAVMALGDAPQWVAADANRTRGEFVLIVSAAAVNIDTDNVKREGDRVLGVLLAELPLKQAVNLAVAITGGKKNDLYERALELKAERAMPDAS